jgi:stage V sporulation protein B
MKKDKFYKDSLILTLSNLTTGIFGFMFSIILSRELGPEGMGLYGLIMPIYNLFICLISGGMVTAISRVSAIYYVKNDYLNLHKSVKISLIFDMCWSFIVVFFVFISSKFIGLNIIKDMRTVQALQIICPAMIFIALSSILKGFFYGTSQIKIPAFIDIFEKAVRIFMVLSIIQLFSLCETGDKVTAAYISLTAGELISLILLYMYYIKKKKSQFYHINGKSEDGLQLLFDVLRISFPLCLNGFLSTAIGTASTLIIPRRLVSAGFEYEMALSMIGKFTGMSLTIVFFPMIVVNSISTILIPDLSQSLAKKDFWIMKKRISEVLKISLLLGISTLIVGTCIPNSLGKMFFNRNDLGAYIKFVAFAAPIAYVSAATFGILNGLGKQKVILKNSLIVSVEELLLLYIFIGIPSVNIYGYGISLIITSLTMLFINLHEIKKISDIDFSISEIIVCMLLSILLYFMLKILNAAISDTILILKNILIIILGFSIFIFSSIFTTRN